MFEFYKDYFNYLSKLDGRPEEKEKAIYEHIKQKGAYILDEEYEKIEGTDPVIKTKLDFLEWFFGDEPKNKYEAMSRWRREGINKEYVPLLMDLDATIEEKSQKYYSLIIEDITKQQKFHEVFCALEIGELVVKSKLYDVIRMAIKTNIKKGSVEEVGYEEFLRNFKDSISSAISVGLIDYNSELDWCDSTDEELEVGLEEENSPEPLEAFTPKFFKKKIENGELDI